MVTRFECPNLFAMFVVVFMHGRVKRQVARLASGYLGAVMLRDWRRRTVLSVSLWRDLESVYSMGDVPRHIHAARVPARFGIQTRAGAFCYAGDWQRVMFGAGQPKASPLEPTPTDRSER